MKSPTLDFFINEIWDFYKAHRRNFPWRETSDPYAILVSEIMLQQTQTSRVVDKYNQFIKRFPTVFSLAEASLSQVLSLWSGLGYNRRAKYLHSSAKILVDEYQGIVPEDPILLQKLPGIGISTASAIVVYSYNTPVPFIETNIRRTFIHHFFKNVADVNDKNILPFVELTMDKTNPREWFWALMDYGSVLPKFMKNPNQKSAHYTKQSVFKGSMRQVRGSILKILIEEGLLTKKRIQQKLKGDTRHLDNALEALVSEGLVVKKGRQYCIQ